MRSAPLGAAILLLAACGAPPPTAPESRPGEAPPSEPAASADALMADGEFLQARRRALADGNPGLVRTIEARAGVRGRPSEPVIHERVAVYEVMNHLSTGERLFREGKHAAAAVHLERGLAEIQRYSLQRRFPSALRNRVQNLLEEARR